MKACVVGYGAMGKIISSMLGDELAANVALECEYKALEDVKEDFDVIIDFSNAKAVPGVLEFALNRNKPFICCTTALSDDTVASILEASEKIAVFKSANMSLGINMMVELAKQATRILYPEFDIEIVEAHHNRKLDAPSGTAMMIASAIDQEIPDNIEYVYDRHSVNKARSKNEIGISSIRGGNIVGEHSAMFISDEEILTISHSAQTRDVFAKGALTAAKFMCGKEKGYFTMSDVIAQYIEK
jgi:4-hydroxy-tetrahydrodipicolinate reductase